MKEVPLERALLWIEPGPVVLVTTLDPGSGKANVMTISWTMAIDFDQRMVLTTGAWNYSFAALMQTRECVVCIPGASMAETAVAIGCVSGKNVDKFERFGLTMRKAQKVSAPLIGECLACLECRVEDVLEPYGIVVLKVLRVVENDEIKDRRLLHARGDGTFVADGEDFCFREMMRAKLPPGL